MNQFANAVEVVKTHLESDQYSYSITRGHLRCYQLLSSYLADEKKTYSKNIANIWLDSITPGLCSSTVGTYRRALEKLWSAYHYRKVESTKTDYDAQQNYQNLIPWCKTLLNTFLKDISELYEDYYVQTIRIAVARFLNYLCSRDVKKPEDISHKIVASFYQDDVHDSYKSKDAYNNHVRMFLRYLSVKGIIRESISLSLDKFVLPRLVYIEDIVGNEQDLLCYSHDAVLSAEEFREKALEMNTLVEQHMYSKSMRKVFRKAWKELFVFLEANSLGYSIDAALAWATHMRQYTVQWKSFRRAMMLFEQYRTSGQINPQKVFSYGADRAEALPEWCKDDFESFYSIKEKGGYAKSTLNMCRSSCLRLLEYLDYSGVSAWSDVTPETLKEFHFQDPHSTAAGKNAYSAKIRIFLEHLGEAGRVSQTLFMAVPNEAAARVNIVKTLSTNDIAEIYQFSQNTADTMGLRHTAMIMIGLRMGIRASDIAELKFSDVSWEQNTILIQQQKTDVFLKLPMPVEVGNALYRYILHGRPDVSSEYIFISHRVPYTGMDRGVCRKALQKALPEKSGGFHVTRKTFASRMMINGVQAGRIAETLGHTTDQNVMTYLSTDNENMRLCAISLARIPVKGGEFA